MYVQILVRYTREVYYISVWSSQIRTRVSKKKYHQSDENYIYRSRHHHFYHRCRLSSIRRYKLRRMCLHSTDRRLLRR